MGSGNPVKPSGGGDTAKPGDGGDHGRRGGQARGGVGVGGKGGDPRANNGRCAGICRAGDGATIVPGTPVYPQIPTHPVIQIPAPTPTPVVSAPTPLPTGTPVPQPSSAPPPTIVGGGPTGAGVGNGVGALGGAPNRSAPGLAGTLGSTVRPTGPLFAQAGTGAGASAALTDSSNANRGTAQASGAGSPAKAGRVPAPASDPTPLQRIERVVPSAVWIALAASLALAALLGTMALWSGFRMRRQGVRLELISAAALTDPLTGVLNRRGFTEAAERELARARRHARPFTLAYIDVRNLKAVNDTEGHRAGDELLRQTALLLKGAARADDVVGRIGGDEMAMMLVEQNAAGAEVVKGRIVQQIATRRAEMGLRAPWDLTIGTAAYPEDGETVEDLLRKADMRLYEQRGIALG